MNASEPDRNSTLRRNHCAIALCCLCWLHIAAANTRAAEEPARDLADRFQLVVVDDFDGKLRLNWQPVRDDPTHYSLTKNPGKLTITTQRGSIHADETKDAFGAGIQAKNIFAIENPLAKEVDFEVTTCVTGFMPETVFQQAGLILYDNDDNYLKWCYEFNWPKDGGHAFVLVRETNGVPDHHHCPPEPNLKQYWLRLAKHDNEYQFFSSTDGKKYTLQGQKLWTGGPKKIGLLAKNGGNPEARELDAAFEFFELRVRGADGNALQAKNADESSKLYDEKADAARHITEALVRAKKSDRRVLLQFGANWCSWCPRLHSLFENNPHVHKMLGANFVVVLVDVDGEHNRDTDRKYGNPSRLGLPALVVLDAEGKQLTTKDTAELEEGEHHDPDKVLAFLKQWAAPNSK